MYVFCSDIAVYLDKPSNMYVFCSDIAVYLDKPSSVTLIIHGFLDR